MLVVGSATASRRVLARYLAAGATVFLVAGIEPTVTVEAEVAHVTTVEFPAVPGGWHHLVSAVDIVVVVETSVATDRRVAAACAAARTWSTRERAAATSGTGGVTLVGGGPGDEGTAHDRRPRGRSAPRTSCISTGWGRTTGSTSGRRGPST